MTLLYLDETYSNAEITNTIVVLVITLVLYLLRNTPLGFLWQIYKWFLIILFATLLIGGIKKSIKDWWQE
jgi:hypothetical protein